MKSPLAKFITQLQWKPIVFNWVLPLFLKVMASVSKKFQISGKLWVALLWMNTECSLLPKLQLWKMGSWKVLDQTNDMNII